MSLFCFTVTIQHKGHKEHEKTTAWQNHNQKISTDYADETDLKSLLKKQGFINL